MPVSFWVIKGIFFVNSYIHISHVTVIDLLNRTHKRLASKKSLVEPVYYDKLYLVLGGAGTVH
jgi:hypothetical protein